MTNDDLIAAARARLDQHGACSDVMKEMKALIEALDLARAEIEGGNESFSAVVEKKQFAEAELKRVKGLLRSAYDHIAKIRASTIEECAKVCNKRAAGTWDRGEEWAAEACASDIRALALPAATGSENILEKD